MSNDRARQAVDKAIREGKIPHAKDRKCVDCGAQAIHHDHYKGYAIKNWLDVEPVCGPCHGKRGVARKEHWRYRLASRRNVKP